MTEMFEKAVALAKKSPRETGKVTPYVSAIAVDAGGNVIGEAFRGELGVGDHAEFTLLEKKLKASSIAGAVLYVTLEPCVKRGENKWPCVDRLIERRVAKVFIGMLDPNPNILGKGYQKLREAGIDVQFFPEPFVQQLEELNRDFRRAQQYGKINDVSEIVINHLSKRRLDDWYDNLNRIYWNRNYHKDYFYLFTHLVEVMGGLSLLASDKDKPGIIPENYVAKALAWWLALCGKVGIKSVEQMLWNKFPRMCPYCRRSPHNPDECTEAKKSGKGLDWGILDGLTDKDERPKTIGEWQQMFALIYPVGSTEKKFGETFARLTEELGELAEALRVFSAIPGYFLSEASDVFAWLMRVQNIIDTINGVTKNNRGLAVNRLMAISYPDYCRDCGAAICTCSPILSKTVGRIAHEVPPLKGSYEERGHFMTVDKSSLRFGFSDQ